MLLCILRPQTISPGRHFVAAFATSSSKVRFLGFGDAEGDNTHLRPLLAFRKGDSQVISQTFLLRPAPLQTLLACEGKIGHSRGRFFSINCSSAFRTFASPTIATAISTSLFFPSCMKLVIVVVQRHMSTSLDSGIQGSFSIFFKSLPRFVLKVAH